MMVSKILEFHRRKSPSEEISSEALVTACAAGDPEALTILYDRYCNDVSRFLSRLTYVDQQDVEDLVQEVFLSVFRSAARYRQHSQVKTWIFAIAANIARETARKRMRYRAFKERMVAEGLEDTSSLQTVSYSDNFLQHLQAKLFELPHDLRVAFVMCDIEGIPGQEVAQTLGIPKGTLYRRLHEARKELQKVFEEVKP